MRPLLAMECAASARESSPRTQGCQLRVGLPPCTAHNTGRGARDQGTESDRRAQCRHPRGSARRGHHHGSRRQGGRVRLRCRAHLWLSARRRRRPPPRRPHHPRAIARRALRAAWHATWQQARALSWANESKCRQCGPTERSSRPNCRLFASRPMVRRSLPGISATSRCRSESEDAIRASAERFRTLVEMSSDAIFLGDGEGRILYATASMVPCHGVFER